MLQRLRRRAVGRPLRPVKSRITAAEVVIIITE